MKFKQYINLLSEGTNIAKQMVQKNKLSQKDFDEIKSLDTSRNFKYVDYIAKEFVEGHLKLDNSIKNFISDLDSAINKKQIDNKWYDISFSELKDKLNNLSSTKSDIRKSMIHGSGLIEGKDYREIYKNDKCEIIQPLNHKASCFFGKSSKWCTTMSNDDQYWKKYTQKDVIFYYILGFDGDKDAVAINKSNSYECYNKEDKIISFSDVLKKWNLKESIFKYTKSNAVELVPNPKTKEEVENNLYFYSIKDYKINSNLTVDVYGDVDIRVRNLTHIPFNFNKVTGDFYCDRNNLTSLEGAPREVGGSFRCYNNKLTSLEGGPEKVDGDFDCAQNDLISLNGAPREIGNTFDCYNNKLTSLEGGPVKVGKIFDCSGNQLTSLIGSPREVGGGFWCYNNQLTSLEGAPKKVGVGFRCKDNKKKFTEEDVKAVSKVKGKIQV